MLDFDDFTFAYHKEKAAALGFDTPEKAIAEIRRMCESIPNVSGKELLPYFPDWIHWNGPKSNRKW